MKCDLEVCITRDVKGMYKRAVRGEIPNFTGISEPYDPSLTPEVVVETDRESPAESAARVLAVLDALNYVYNGLGPVGELQSEGIAQSTGQRVPGQEGE